jgi:hypothetical protein
MRDDRASGKTVVIAWFAAPGATGCAISPYYPDRPVAKPERPMLSADGAAVRHTLGEPGPAASKTGVRRQKGWER